MLEKKVEGSLREVWCQMIFETFCFLFQDTWYIFTLLLHTLHFQLNNNNDIQFFLTIFENMKFLFFRFKNKKSTFFFAYS